MFNLLTRLLNSFRRSSSRRPPIEFASRDKIEPLQHLADRFIEDIFGVKGAFVTDESSLWDFESKDDLSAIHKKIREKYGVDVRDVREGNLVEILTRIER
jgi:hypothetical protein